jgi:hypothetical protein
MPNTNWIYFCPPPPPIPEAAGSNIRPGVGQVLIVQEVQQTLEAYHVPPPSLIPEAAGSNIRPGVGQVLIVQEVHQALEAGLDGALDDSQGPRLQVV